MDIQKEQKINADLFKEKIDTNLLYGSIEITLLNKLFKNYLFNHSMIFSHIQKQTNKRENLQTSEREHYKGI